MITFVYPPSMHDRVPDTLEDPGCPPPDAQLRPPEIPFRPPNLTSPQPIHLPPCISTDHCDLRNDAEVQKLMAKHGEPPIVLFSCEVLKINRRAEAVQRTMLVCANALYLLDADTKRSRRKIPTRSIASLRMSEMSDNFLGLVCPAEYDLLLVCARKTELVVVLREAHASAMAELGLGGDGSGRDVTSGGGRGGGDVYEGLPVELANRFTYKAGANVTKVVTFTRAGDGEVDTNVADAP